MKRAMHNSLEKPIHRPYSSSVKRATAAKEEKKKVALHRPYQAIQSHQMISNRDINFRTSKNQKRQDSILFIPIDKKKLKNDKQIKSLQVECYPCQNNQENNNNSSNKNNELFYESKNVEIADFNSIQHEIAKNFDFEYNKMYKKCKKNTNNIVNHNNFNKIINQINYNISSNASTSANSNTNSSTQNKITQQSHTSCQKRSEELTDTKALCKNTANTNTNYNNSRKNSSNKNRNKILAGEKAHDIKLAHSDIKISFVEKDENSFAINEERKLNIYQNYVTETNASNSNKKDVKKKYNFLDKELSAEVSEFKQCDYDTLELNYSTSNNITKSNLYENKKADWNNKAALALENRQNVNDLKVINEIPIKENQKSNLVSYIKKSGLKQYDIQNINAEARTNWNHLSSQGSLSSKNKDKKNSHFWTKPEYSEYEYDCNKNNEYQFYRYLLNSENCNFNTNANNVLYNKGRKDSNEIISNNRQKNSNELRTKSNKYTNSSFYSRSGIHDSSYSKNAAVSNIESQNTGKDWGNKCLIKQSADKLTINDFSHYREEKSIVKYDNEASRINKKTISKSSTTNYESITKSSFSESEKLRILLSFRENQINELKSEKEKLRICYEILIKEQMSDKEKKEEETLIAEIMLINSSVSKFQQSYQNLRREFDFLTGKLDDLIEN